MGLLKLAGVVAAALIVVSILAAGTGFVIGMTGMTGGASAGQSPTAIAPTRTFTMLEFDQYITGKTKAQVRADLGTPDEVDGVDDMWFYSERNTSVVVMDPDAGKRVSVWVEFGRETGSVDPAIGAHD